ncbi:Repetitive proline-rich cell wall protein 1 [Diplonema papillatum]|nr:Repetitive proline-rich cell wall protein 1 [Diplonema papillatum]KAJ9464600.1 Repetitive proline-rich cell wall protein 1 [Diplonema papillatum]
MRGWLIVWAVAVALVDAQGLCSLGVSTQTTETCVAAGKEDVTLTSCSAYGQVLGILPQLITDNSRPPGCVWTPALAIVYNRAPPDQAASCSSTEICVCDDPNCTPAPPPSTPSTAPDTAVPSVPATTSSPLTAAPATSAPLTLAPATGTPGTAAPLATAAPATAAPAPSVTLAPLTAAPATGAPATSAPATAIPATTAPLTAAPAAAPSATSAPLTSAPATAAPATSAPLTLAPATTAPETSAPLTSAPDTTAPATSAPLTSAPDTEQPATPAPLTSAPDTAAPVSSAPATSAPGTSWPATSAPASSATDAPLTDAPATVASVEQTSRPEVPQSAAPGTHSPLQRFVKSEPALETAQASAVVAAAVLGGPAAASGSVLLLLIEAGCDGELPELNRLQHPTGISIGGSQALGAVVGNFIVIAAVAALCMLTVYALERIGTKSGRFLDIRSTLRFPGAPLFVLMFLYQGTALGSVHLAMHAEHTSAGIAGGASLAFLLVVPGVLARKIRQSIPSTGEAGNAYFRLDREPLSAARRFLVGPGEWVSPVAGRLWVRRYQTMVVSYNQPHAWFSVVDFWAMAVTAGVVATEPSTAAGCGNVRVVLALVSAAQCILEVKCKPHGRARDTVADALRLFLQAVALGLMAIGFYSEQTEERHWGFDAAAVVFVLAIGVLVVKLLLDIAAVVLLFTSKRRERLQDEAWAEIRAFDADSEAAGLVRPKIDLPSANDDGAVEMEACTTLTPELAASVLPSPAGSPRGDFGSFSGTTATQRDPFAFPGDAAWNETGFHSNSDAPTVHTWKRVRRASGEFEENTWDRPARGPGAENGGVNSKRKTLPVGILGGAVASSTLLGSSSLLLKDGGRVRPPRRQSLGGERAARAGGDDGGGARGSRTASTASDEAAAGQQHSSSLLLPADDGSLSRARFGASAYRRTSRYASVPNSPDLSPGLPARDSRWQSWRKGNPVSPGLLPDAASAHHSPVLLPAAAPSPEASVLLGTRRLSRRYAAPGSPDHPPSSPRQQGGGGGAVFDSPLGSSTRRGSRRLSEGHGQVPQGPPDSTEPSPVIDDPLGAEGSLAWSVKRRSFRRVPAALLPGTPRRSSRASSPLADLLSLVSPLAAEQTTPSVGTPRANASLRDILSSPATAADGPQPLPPQRAPEEDSPRGRRRSLAGLSHNTSFGSADFEDAPTPPVRRASYRRSLPT